MFSLGAVIRRLGRSGRRVTVLTVLGNDPDSTRDASPWDRRSGFVTEGAAAAGRRAEDRRACDRLGARQETRAFGDAEYGRGAADAEVWDAIVALCENAALCLIPGFPLTHSDHAWLASLVLRRGLPDTAVGLYLEQPYASSARDPRRWVRRPGVAHALEDLLPDGLVWETVGADLGDRTAKLRACYAYRSQLPLLPGRRGLPWKIAAHEALRGGETLALARAIGA